MLGRLNVRILEVTARFLVTLDEFYQLVASGALTEQQRQASLREYPSLGMATCTLGNFVLVGCDASLVEETEGLLLHIVVEGLTDLAAGLRRQGATILNGPLRTTEGLTMLVRDEAGQLIHLWERGAST